ncbi:GDSL-type esterase/lipase family protein [Edaphobacter aggregans]|uniref:GDSL-type esterase/lipase family protein n=1 Tax=Edaphobacter aggregans TaxID=570835 RepID=UPI0005588389|nr:GDSL-type esterase/lipase family protein [Edaphobacter aggregans]
MSWKRGGRTLVGILLAVPGMLAVLAVGTLAQVVTTQVIDTIYRANGTPAGGSVIVNWPAFTSASGQTVASGSTAATLSAGGVLSVQLAPNAGARPMGTYYAAVYHLDDGSVSREYWVIPASQSPVHLSAVRSAVLPTSVAMQTVSKSYVDTAIAAAVAGHPLDTTNPYVLKQGDTMTGPLVLSGDPTAPAQAATKSYVDLSVNALASGLGQKVATLPFTTQTVAQPAGTNLEVNRLNGVEYASQYQDARGDNGIANAVSSSDCASGCDVKAEPTYGRTEGYTPSQWNSQTHVEDLRLGQRRDSFKDPESAITPGTEAGEVVTVTSTRGGATVHQLTGSGTPASVGMMIFHQGLAGGSNHFPENVDTTVPYFKTGYSALMLNGLYNTQGQHVLAPTETDCFGVGDCLIGSQFLLASGGFRDNADEGAHPFDLQIREDSRLFTGTCASGCSTGSTSLTVSPITDPGTQGDGRYLINTNPAKVLTAGRLIGQGTSGPNASAAFSGTSFPVSTFFRIAQAVPSQAHDVAPGTVTVAIATTGLPSGFASNTVAAPASSGVACLADPTAAVNGVEVYEMANYTVVDGTHLQFTLNRAHAAQATVAIGGLCGYGLEQTVDTVGRIRQVFPVLGSYSSTGLYYAGGATAIVGLMNNTSAFVNLSAAITSAVRNGNTVTVTTAGNLPVDVNGLTMNIAGVTDASYNGSFVVTTTGPNTLTYTQSGANSTSSGGTISVLTGRYALYPMAEVLSVMNPATKLVDGTMTLAPNTVTWAANDPVEEPHYYQEKVGPDLEYVSQYVPRPTSAQQAGMQYEGNNGPGLIGWTVTNSAAASNYFGNGGTHSAPAAAYVAKGVWLRSMIIDAGEQSVFTIHCNSHGCGKWNSSYNLFELDSSVATDTIAFQPTTSSLSMVLRGTGYTFSPQGFTAGTINAGTVNATTLNGAVSASQLPVFHASGASHAQGAVPDPGATTGTTRFLREDGTWAVPAGGVSGSGGTGGVGGSAGSTLLPGATADYSFLEGAGTTVTDSTANGDDATLSSGSAAPAWTSTGLKFATSQGVSLPAALNNTRTFFMAVYINPLTAGSQPSNGFPVMVSSSQGGNGFNYMYELFDGGNVIQHAYSPRLYINNSPRTSVGNVISGFHVLAVTLGTGGGSLDHIYIDGAEVPSYTMQGASAGAQTTGNLFLGSSNISPWTGSGLNGIFYRLRTYPTELAASDVQTISTAIRNEVAIRGVMVTSQPIVAASPQLHAIGDSITFGQGASSPWPSLLTLTNQPTYTTTNWGISGIQMQEINGSESNRVGMRCLSNYGPSVAVVFAGTNDLTGGSSTTTTFSALVGEIQTLKQAGCKVFVGTMLSRIGLDPSGATVDSDKNTYDTLILGRARQVGADGIIDFAANPLLGADGAYANTTYFNTDGTHPTTAGQQLLANAASNALNYTFGYNDTNPRSVTTLPYSMAAGDGSISLSGLTGAGTLTLPDCTGQSGAVYRINNPQSAYTVNVAPLNANQLINGLAFGTTVTVPANGTLTLRDVPNPKAVSGCHWEM